MKRAKRKIFKAVVLIVSSTILILFASAAAFIYFYPKEKVLALLVNTAEKNLNKKIDIKGIDYGFRGIKLIDVTISEKRVSPLPDAIIAQAHELRLRFSLFSLLKKKLKINYVYLNQLSLIIEFDEKGISNIERLMMQTKEDQEAPVKTEISSISLEKASITLKNPPFPIRYLTGTYVLDGNIDINPDNEIEFTECALILPENRGILNPEIKISSRNNEFEITGGIGIDKLSLLWISQLGNINLPYNLVSGSITNVKINRQTAECFLKLSATLRTSFSPLFAHGYCKVNIPGNTVFLSNIDGRLQTSSFLIKNLLFSTYGKIFDFNIESVDADLSDLRLILEMIPAKLYGKLQGNLSFNNGAYNGSLKIIDAGFDIKSRTVSGLSADLLIKDSTFIKENIPLKIYDNDVFLSLASTDRSMNRIFINLNGKTVRIRPESPAAPAESKTPTAFNFPVRLTGKISVDEFTMNDVVLQNLFISYDLYGNRLDLNKISAQYMGGNIAGDMNVIISDPPAIQTGLSFSGIKIQDVLARTKQFNNRFFGIADGKAQVNFTLEKDILNSMDGKIEFSISKGKAVDTGIQNGLGVLLSELKYKLKDLEFNQIYGNVSISRNVFTINSFIFNSPSLRLGLKGTLNDKLIAQPLLITLEFNNYFIKELPGPAVAFLAKYLTGIWYTIPIACEGDITLSKNMKLLR